MRVTTCHHRHDVTSLQSQAIIYAVYSNSFKEPYVRNPVNTQALCIHSLSMLPLGMVMLHCLAAWSDQNLSGVTSACFLTSISSINQFFTAKAQRLAMCKHARVVGAQPRPRPQGTPTLANVWRETRTQVPKKVTSLPPPPAQTRETRSFAKFPLHNPEIKEFMAYLTGLDGKRKSLKEAKAIATDIFKKITFANPTALHPRWEALLDRQAVRRYFDYLETSGNCGVDGQSTKMDRLVVALSYIKVESWPPEDEGYYFRCTKMVDLLCEWKTTLRGVRRFKQQQCLLEGQDDPTMRETTALLSCNKLWVNVEDFLVMARIGGLERYNFGC